MLLKIKAWLQTYGTRWSVTALGILVLVVTSYVAWPLRQSISLTLNNNPLMVLFSLAGLAAAIWQSMNLAGKHAWKSEVRDISIIILVVVFAVAGGIYLASAIRHLATPATAEGAARLVTLWTLAYFASGFLIGFLFGIPRVLQKEDPKASAATYVQLTNTNLEQISDWLTKIIVGLGLVQLKELPDYLDRAANTMARSFMPLEGVQLSQITSVASSIVVFFSIIGFLAGYLITRLYLSGAFLRAARAEELSEIGASKDGEATSLRDYWMPGGNADAEKEKLLLAWIAKEGLDTDIASFINLPAYAEQRSKAAKELIQAQSN